ncbi:TPA: hypothetical protein N0F65_011683 [Lagenidium giganteum]|uniref:Transposase n=1 Tax=Lagenidium giganteum TaxID=4803 RepID=A0AAV2ZB92_9STRA|nr:TPA: hypothetical protein N0F65_011683 [Lagenidium giganteum]
MVREEEAVDSDSPVMDQFNANLDLGWIEVTINFDAAQFDVLWALVKDAELPKWSMGRGRRHITRPKDAVLMMLTVLKHYDTWEKHLIRPVTVKEQRDRQMVFKYYPRALYATDVKFQPANRPTGLFPEQKWCFSGKHWQYGFKLECAVAYPGIAVHLSQHYPGLVHDMTIFLEKPGDASQAAGQD